MTREPKHQVSLSSKAYPTITSHLSAWTDEKGLVLEGQDLGPGVGRIWGDSDYEYWLRVDRKHLGRVIDGLATKLDTDTELPDEPSKQDNLLLELMQRSWTRGLFETDVGFRKWLEAIGVPSEFSSYA